MHIHIYMCKCIYVYKHMYVYMYMYIYIHTQTHTYTHSDLFVLKLYSLFSGDLLLTSQYSVPSTELYSSYTVCTEACLVCKGKRVNVHFSTLKLGPY